MRILDFAWSTIAICIPTYILIGSLSTDSGMIFWTHLWRRSNSMTGHGLARILGCVGYQPRWTENYRKRVQEEETPTWRPRHKRSYSQERLMMSRYAANGGMPLLSRGPTRETHVADSNQTSIKEGNVQLNAQILLGDLPPRVGPEKPSSPHRPSAATLTFDDRKKSAG
jgi:hypothetical protein